MTPKELFKLAEEVVAWDDGKKPRSASNWIHGDTIALAREVLRLQTPQSESKAFTPPTHDEVAAYRNLFRSELDKNMHNSSGSPSTDAHTVALHAFVEARNKKAAK